MLTLCFVSVYVSVCLCAVLVLLLEVSVKRKGDNNRATVGNKQNQIGGVWLGLSIWCAHTCVCVCVRFDVTHIVRMAVYGGEKSATQLPALLWRYIYSLLESLSDLHCNVQLAANSVKSLLTCVLSILMLGHYCQHSYCMLCSRYEFTLWVMLSPWEHRQIVCVCALVDLMC